jgi:hypothetical protein
MKAFWVEERFTAPLWGAIEDYWQFPGEALRLPWAIFGRSLRGLRAFSRQRNQLGSSLSPWFVFHAIALKTCDLQLNTQR